MPEKSSVYRLGQAAGRMTKAWLEVIAEFTTGFQQELGDSFDDLVKKAVSPSSDPNPEQDDS